MSVPGHVVLPLVCAALYAAGALWFKRALHSGVGVWRATFLSNVMLGVVAIPSAFFVARGTDWSVVWLPVVCGLVFLLGQLTTMLAFSRGDVSMATPLMGIKSILVAGFSAMLLSEGVPLAWWVAALLSAVAVALLGYQGRGKHAIAGHGVAFAAVCVSMLLYGLNDVLIQKLAGGLGALRFLSFMFAVVALGSVAFIPFFSGRLRAITREGWRATIPGSIAMALNHIGIGLALAIFGAATAVNVVYSSRGLIAIAFVWWAGSWFGNDERTRGPDVIRRRLFGALLLVAAIVLVVVAR